jgi:hypothetical protein
LFPYLCVIGAAHPLLLCVCAKSLAKKGISTISTSSAVIFTLHTACPRFTGPVPCSTLRSLRASAATLRLFVPAQIGSSRSHHFICAKYIVVIIQIDAPSNGVDASLGFPAPAPPWMRSAFAAPSSWISY